MSNNPKNDSLNANARGNFWLGTGRMSEIQKEGTQEVWVNVAEATELTGYNFSSVRTLVYRISLQPESEREIRLRKRANRWEMWLPDLISYLNKPGRGPHLKE